MDLGLLIAMTIMYLILINGMLGGMLYSTVEYPFVLPSDIYKNTNVNWFGAIFIYLLTFIAFAPWCILKFIVWICTVGREEKE